MNKVEFHIQQSYVEKLHEAHDLKTELSTILHNQDVQLQNILENFSDEQNITLKEPTELTEHV